MLIDIVAYLYKLPHSVNLIARNTSHHNFGVFYSVHHWPRNGYHKNVRNQHVATAFTAKLRQCQQN